MLRGSGDRVGAAAHFADDLHQAFAHVLEGLQQLAGFILAVDDDRLCQIARGNRFRKCHCGIDRLRDRFRDEPGNQYAGYQGGDGYGPDQQARITISDVHLLDLFGGILFLVLRHLTQRIQPFALPRTDFHQEHLGRLRIIVCLS